MPGDLRGTNVILSNKASCLLSPPCFSPCIHVQNDLGASLYIHYIHLIPFPAPNVPTNFDPIGFIFPQVRFYFLSRPPHLQRLSPTLIPIWPISMSYYPTASHPFSCRVVSMDVSESSPFLEFEMLVSHRPTSIRSYAFA
jgi:hypothetical protein